MPSGGAGANGTPAGKKTATRVHVDLVPLYGVNEDAPRMECYLVLGYDFGSLKPEAVMPTSTRGR